MTMQPAPSVMFKAPEIHATIERDVESWAGLGWFVQVWTSPMTATRTWTFTRAGARRAARRGVALERRRLTAKTDRETIR